MSQLVCGWGTQTHTADSLTGWYRGLRRVRKKEPRHPGLRGCPAKGRECPQEHTSHQRPSEALTHSPHTHTCILIWSPELMGLVDGLSSALLAPEAESVKNEAGTLGTCLSC